MDPPSSDTGDTPIDYDHLAQILGSADPEFVSTMLALFRDSYNALDGRMRSAIADQDAGELREAAHAAKGASANACAVRLRDALEKLEFAAAGSRWADVPDIWSEVETSSGEVFHHLDGR